jgi:Tol biopolymer transport system component
MTAPRRRWSAFLLIIALLASSLLFTPSSDAQNPMPPGRIAYGQAGEIWVWQNGQTSKLFGDGQASDPRWSPDGHQLLYVNTGDSYSDLYLRNLTDNTETQLTFNQPADQQGGVDYVGNSIWALDPAWSQSGLIAYASDPFTPNGFLALWLLNDPSAGPSAAPSAQDEGSIESVTLTTDGGVAGYTVRQTNDDGTSTTYVALRDLSDGIAYTLADDPGGVYDPAIAPNNEDVAVTIRSSSGVSDIWTINRQTGNRTRVTTDAEASSPCWSPDGKWIAYVRMVNFEFEIWASPVNPDGTFGAPVKLAHARAIDAPGGMSWTLVTS